MSACAFIFGRRITVLCSLAFLTLTTAFPVQAGLLDTIKDQVIQGTPASTQTAQTSQANLSTSDITKGLKEALRSTVSSSVSMLSKEGGFLNTPTVRIPVPQSLQSAEKLARSMGQDELVDNFIGTMNSAAEQATKETTTLFLDAISKMSFEDARSILNGPSDAATSFFKRTSTADLTKRIRPIVEAATAKADVTSAYKDFSGKLKLLSPLMKTQSTDLDGYVTDKTVQGIFTIMAQEEEKIRANPAGQSADIIKKVFGSLVH